MANERQDRDLVLSPNTFAHVMDTTKGILKVYVGPYMNSLSQTDQLVVWDPGTRRFQQQPSIDRAIQVSPIAAEGQYIVLINPAASGDQPKPGTNTPATDLNYGRKINVPGPVSFPLWPGQTALTIDGHHLRNNQYLLVRVYDEGQAKANWKLAVVKPAAPTQGQQGVEPKEVPPAPAVADAAPDLVMGKLIVIKGTDVSFYIPPTGVEVVPESANKFVREAVTLEMLEYCILLDENGTKRYVRGPAVVFPQPTEKFLVNKNARDSDDARKFDAIELNPHSGLYVKVISDYEGHKTGEELFIKGDATPIYFPRVEHSIITYGGQQKHHAIAIPAGEGRYVLDRNTGTIDLVVGPKMFLPDPRTQVVVKRILDPATVELLYPGNREALAVNEQYRVASASLSPGQYLESSEQARASAMMLTARSGREADGGGDAFRRGTQYTPPRTLVLDTKYEGAVAVNIWPGYAVQVTKKTGERRVEVGPKMVLLEYDENLMPLELSTGRPKNDTKLLRTCYLRVANNQVSDLVTVETRDLVKVSVEISYRVNFEGMSPEEMLKWFAVENYVKVLTDHCRSRMRNEAKRRGIQEFYTNAIDLIRDALLGETPEEGKRTGLPFEENGMRVYDVEVLNVSIEDRTVAGLLVNAQSKALSGAITLSEAEDDAKRVKKLEELARGNLKEKEETAKANAEAAKAAIERQVAQIIAKAKGDREAFNEGKELAAGRLEQERVAREQAIELDRKAAVQFLERLKGETEQFIARTGAVSEKMVTALSVLGDQAFVDRLVTSVAPAALAAGTTTADLLKQIFKGTPFEQTLATLAERPLKVIDGQGRRAS